MQGYFKVMAPLLAVLLVTLGSPALFAQSTGYNTGDKELDSALHDTDIDSAADPATFLKRVADQYGVDVKDLQALRDQGFKPGDILMALRLSKAANKPLSDIVANWTAGKAKGWGAIALNLGIKPGSDAFQAIKKSVLADKDKPADGDKMKPDTPKPADGDKKPQPGKKP